MSLRHSLFSIGSKIVGHTGADRWLRRFSGGRGVILMFHHVRPWRERDFAPNRPLEITPHHLERALVIARQLGFEIVPLGKVPDRLADGGSPPFVALTFDDAYRDNLEHAMPVLAKHGAPWTVFVTTDFAEGRGRLWWLELEQAVARLDRVAVEAGGKSVDLPARSAAQKTRAYGALYRILRSGPEGLLLDTVTSLNRTAGVDAGALAPALCLSWQELRELSRDPAVTIGAHSLTHSILAKRPSDVAAREIRESKAVVEDQLGVEVCHFAFPFGDETAAGPREFALARSAGFRTAVTTRRADLYPAHRHQCHALPRVQVNGLLQTEAALRTILSGAPGLFRRPQRSDPKLASEAKGPSAADTRH